MDANTNHPLTHEKHADDGAPSDWSRRALEQKAENQEPVYVTGWKLFVIMATINLSTLIASLDLGIVATAIPTITRDFQSLNGIAWYSAACFILVGTTSAFWGKLFTFFPASPVYMASLILYIVGSIVAATATYPIPLIIGRAIQGLACGGALSGSVLLINFVAAPKHRAMLIGTWMAVFMVSTILGPLLGGVFTTEVTWRWCFWINLPVGGLALILQILFLRVPAHIKPQTASWKEVIRHLDLLGFLILTSSVICYVLALEWGGLERSWSDGSVIATLVMWLVLLLAFMLNECLHGPYAMIPRHLFAPRLAWSSCLYAFLANCANFQTLFYLPIYFQSVKGTSAIISGVYMLPYVGLFALGSLLSGIIITKTGRAQVLEMVSPLIVIIATVLLFKMDAKTSKAWFIGAQIPLGFGLGLGCQVPVTVLQAFAKPEEVAATTGMIFTFQTVSGAIFVTAAQSILENRIHQVLEFTAPYINPDQVDAAGAGDLHQSFQGSELDAVVGAYVVGLKDVFAFAIAGAVVTFLLSLIIPMKKLPQHDGSQQEGKDEKADV